MPTVDTNKTDVRCTRQFTDIAIATMACNFVMSRVYRPYLSLETQTRALPYYLCGLSTTKYGDSLGSKKTFEIQSALLSVKVV